MATLQRRDAGGFGISDSYSIAELENMSEAERLSLLKPTESLFEDIPKIILPEFYEKLSRNGCEIYQKKIKTSFATGEKVRLYGKNGVFFALGEVREYPDGSALKAIKIFDI